jgi:NADH-quinone oxidoreductase subunit A
MSGLYELYLPVLLTFLVAAAIAFGMWAGGVFVGKKNPTPEKVLPYECGNDTRGGQGVRAHVKFYLVAILFVVFDIEVVFMYPWAVLFRSLGWAGFAAMSSFIAALLVALAYCWKKGALEWEN